MIALIKDSDLDFILAFALSAFYISISLSEGEISNFAYPALLIISALISIRVRLVALHFAVLMFSIGMLFVGQMASSALYTGEQVSMMYVFYCLVVLFFGASEFRSESGVTAIILATIWALLFLFFSLFLKDHLMLLSVLLAFFVFIRPLPNVVNIGLSLCLTMVFIFILLNKNND